MKYTKLFIGAMLMASAAIASAADFNNKYAITLDANDDFFTGAFTNSFGAGSKNKTFLDTYSFTLDTTSSLDGLISSIASIQTHKGNTVTQFDLDITSFTLFLGGKELASSSVYSTGYADLQTFTTSGLVAGVYSLQVAGKVLGSKGGTYAGVVNMAPIAPVPEPESWAMMAAGLATVGFISRRRKLNVQKSAVAVA